MDNDCNKISEPKKVQDFLKGKLTLAEQDEIYLHLLGCLKCLKTYKFYSRTLFDEKFTVSERAIQFCNNNLERKLKTRDLLISKGTKGLLNIDTKYEELAKEFKLSKLKDVEAVSRLFMGDETIESIKDTELLLEFTKHLCYNICKEIDLLERCYRKGMGVLVENNIPKKEVIIDEPK